MAGSASRVGRRALFIGATASLSLLTTGCVFERTRPVTAQEARSALSAALSRTGDPYVWGGQAPGGFDCSGLILWAYEQSMGALRMRRPDGQIVSDATMHEIYSWHCLHLRPEEVRPGDIVAIAQDGSAVATHGGLVETVDGDGVWFVNASSYWQKVVSDVWPLAGEKRGQVVLGFGRILVVERRLFGVISI